MELDKKWSWKDRKLECRIRPETGNPGGDDLRERLAQLAGVNLQELLAEMKNDKKKKEAANKVHIDHEADMKFKEVLHRAHVVGASQFAMTAMHQEESKEAGNKSRKNINKRFAVQPKAPPRRVLMDIIRERAKPLMLPNPDEKSLETNKLEKKLAKQRAARKAKSDGEAKQEESLPKFENTPFGKLSKSIEHILVPYSGDMFSTNGNYLSGLLYLSKMMDDEARKKVEASRTLGPLGQALATAERVPEHDAHESESEREDNDAEQVIEDHMHVIQRTEAEDMAAKLYCAKQLCNWARNPSNVMRLLEEGSIPAILLLSQETSELEILKFVSACLRYMSTHEKLAVCLIECQSTMQYPGCVTACADLITHVYSIKGGNYSQDIEFILTNLVVCLVNLTHINGTEGTLVDDNVVQPLMQLAQQSPLFASACARGLYNLTCVDQPYSLYERVIRALLSISVIPNPQIKHVTAAAICNLADLKSVRSRMVDEGVISTLTTLTRGSETRTRRVCAVILQNLSASRACRAEMMARSCVQVAYALSSEQDPIILRCVGITLARLSLEKSMSSRLITDGGIMALCNIVIKYPNIPAISLPAATAFQSLSAQPTIAHTMVFEGSVNALGTLLKQSEDLGTMCQSLYALCNLCKQHENHESIVKQDMLPILQQLCNAEDAKVKDLVALAFLLLSLHKNSHKHIVSAGASSSIISLSQSELVSTKCRCAITLCNLSLYDLGVHKMVSEGIIPALVDLMNTDDASTTRFAVVGLCRLCSTESNTNTVISAGALPAIVHQAMHGEETTRHFCAATISALTVYENNRVRLCRFEGLIESIKLLSEMQDDDTKHRCLVALCNFSCEVEIQGDLVSTGVVKVIANLANSYHETDQQCCAKALCNLSCNEEARLRICEDGGVEALMMIGMVRSYDMATKSICVEALSNLLDDKTRLCLIEEGIVGAIANLCRIPDPKTPDTHVVHLCSSIYCFLSTCDEGRLKIAEKASYLVSLYGMVDVGAPENPSQINTARCVANLVAFAPVSERALDSGALRVLDKALQFADEDTCSHVVKACYLAACAEPKYRLQMARSSVPSTLAKLARGSGSESDRQRLCIKTLTALAWHEESGRFLQNAEFVQLVLLLVEEVPPQDEDMALAAAQLLCYLLLDYPMAPELVNAGIPKALLHLGMSESELVAAQMAGMLRILASNEVLIEELATADTIRLLLAAARLNSSSACQYNVIVAIYLIVSHSPESRVAVSTPDLTSTLEIVSLNGPQRASELLAAVLCTLACDMHPRLNLCGEPTALMFSRVFENATHADGSIIPDAHYNLVSAIFFFCKVPSMRRLMVDKDLDVLLAQMLKNTEDSDLKGNLTRANKDIASDMGEAIEEGAVASLIQLSIEGKVRHKVNDDLKIHPDMIATAEFPLKPPLGPPRALAEAGGLEWSAWRPEVVRALGGAAGKGPMHPELPKLQPKDVEENPGKDEDVEGDGTEGKSKMQFAKAGVPKELSAAHLLSDDDFGLKEPLEDEPITALEPKPEPEPEPEPEPVRPSSKMGDVLMRGLHVEHARDQMSSRGSERPEPEPEPEPELSAPVSQPSSRPSSKMGDVAMRQLHLEHARDQMSSKGSEGYELESEASPPPTAP